MSNCEPCETKQNMISAEHNPDAANCIYLPAGSIDLNQKKNYQVEAYKRCENSDQQLGFLIATLDKLVRSTTEYLIIHNLRSFTEDSDLSDARELLAAIKQQDAEFWVNNHSAFTAAFQELIPDAT